MWHLGHWVQLHCPHGGDRRDSREDQPVYLSDVGVNSDRAARCRQIARLTLDQILESADRADVQNRRFTIGELLVAAVSRGRVRGATPRASPEPPDAASRSPGWDRQDGWERVAGHVGVLFDQSWEMSQQFDRVLRSIHRGEPLDEMTQRRHRELHLRAFHYALDQLIAEIRGTGRVDPLGNLATRGANPRPAAYEELPTGQRGGQRN